MLYTEYGKTGVKTSRLGLGAMRLPMKDNHVLVDEAVAVIRRAIDLGVNYIDTAPYYCGQESEATVGKAIKGYDRSKLYVSTKYPVKDSSVESFRRMLEQSLTRLDTPYIDFYHFWGINWKSFDETISIKGGPLDEAVKAKDEGLIKHISFSFHDKPEALEKILRSGAGRLESMLVQYNLLDRANEDQIALAHELGLGVAVMGPVGGGSLSTPAPVIQGMLKGRAVSTPELALRFVLANPSINIALSGMSTVQMVEENAALASNPNPLSDEEVRQIREAADSLKAMADLYCTGCSYCMPCPAKVDIPSVFRVYNLHRVYGLTDLARRRFNETEKRQKGPSVCADCGVCETKCPQHLPIRKQLKEALAVLGN